MSWNDQHCHRSVRAGLGLVLGLLFAVAPSWGAAGDIDLTIDGVPFYAARASAQNTQVIEIAGSSTVLVTWEETVESGELKPHYGISLDGQTIVRTSLTSYELGFRYAQFDPLDGLPEIAPALQADPGSRLHLVQCHTQPLEEFARQISALGGIVRHYVAEFAYLVEMEPAARAEVEALEFVRWVGVYHPAYRLEEFMVEHLDEAELYFPFQIYSVQVLAVEQKAEVAERLASIGAIVHNADAGKHLVFAQMNPSQLLEAVGWNEVLFIDRWGPYETDMNVAREISGADHIETVAGYTGEGVVGEVFDAGFNLQHQDFVATPLIEHGGAVSGNSHGAATSGINFGDGSGSATARGLLPDGQGIVADYGNVGLTGVSRYNHSGELLNPPYEAVFQTSSVGSPRTTAYTTISADHDGILFDFDVTHCQSQSNSGWEDSRPQAWAKNIISGGGVRHYNTLNKADDCWCSGASIGPASDGRIKPTLTHFYDQIRTVYYPGVAAYTNTFGGTSGATPIICGYVGLFFDMWSDGIFGNPVNPTGTPFENRSHMTTAKAMLVNSADQYNFIGAGHDLTRVHQGWGMPNVQNLYELRNNILVIDETEVLEPFETATYQVEVLPGEPFFKVTMTYADPPGNPAVQTQHRINDVDLRVISPGGALTWYGNAGLYDTPWSVPGAAGDDKNTVENVFVLQPDPGFWTIEVQAMEVLQDGHTETTALDVDFALVATPIAPASTPVELSRFDVVRDGDRATISWQVTDAHDHAGFNVYRQLREQERAQLNDELIRGGVSYEFVDEAAPTTGAEYWLEEISLSGAASWLGSRRLAPASPVVGATLAMAPAEPNPFLASTRVAYSLALERDVNVSVYTVEGRLVRVLVDESQLAGDHAVSWDGRTDAGRQAATGVYLMKVQAGSDISVQKVMLMR